MKNLLVPFIPLILLLTSCNLASTPTVEPAPVTQTGSASETSSPNTPTPNNTATPFDTLTPTVVTTLTFTPTATIVPTAESIKATVTADKLSCRYGPGPEYLYLYGLRQGANIELIGRTDANNWVLVQGKNLCWVNTKFLEIQGDKNTLAIKYPEGYKLPVSPYYSPTDWVGAKRNGNTVEVEWNEVPVNIGDYEDESMFTYIIEVWRCENGEIIFDPLATSDLGVTFIDEPGCSVPSHGRVYVQEKHGYAGPVEIPWP